MANKMINELPAGTISSPNDVLIFQDTAGSTKKLLWSDIISRMGSADIEAGSNITKQLVSDANGVHIRLSSSGESYTAGDGIDIADNEISVKLGENLSFNAQTGAIDAQAGGSSYTAGSGIDISNDTVSVDISGLDGGYVTSGGDYFLFQTASGDLKKYYFGSFLSSLITQHFAAGNDISITYSNSNIMGIPKATISSTASSYTAGDGIDISNADVISAKLGNSLSINANTGNIDVTPYTGGGGIAIDEANKLIAVDYGYGLEISNGLLRVSQPYFAGDGININGYQISVKLGTGLAFNASTGNIDVTGGGGGSVWYFGSTQPASANNGDYWLRTDTGHYGEVDNYDGTSWTAVGTFAGQDGVTPHIDSTTKHWFIGDTDTNIVAEGQNGAAGSDGSAASVSVGTVTTGEPGTNASVTNSGTSSAAVLDFVIPKGAKGDKGDDGVTTIQTTSSNFTVSLPASGWVGSSAPYTQTVAAAGVTADNAPVLDVSVSDTTAAGIEQIKQWGYISKASTAADSITFSCYETKPTVDLTVNVKVV